MGVRFSLSIVPGVELYLERARGPAPVPLLFNDGDFMPAAPPPSVEDLVSSRSLRLTLTTICLKPGMIAVGPSQRKYGIRLRGPENNGCSGMSPEFAGAAVVSIGPFVFGESSTRLFGGFDVEDTCWAKVVLESGRLSFVMRSPAFAAGRLGSFVARVVLSDSVRLPLLAAASLEYPAQSSLFCLQVSQNGRSPEQQTHQYTSICTNSTFQPYHYKQSSSSCTSNKQLQCAASLDVVRHNL